jgi:dihydroflavonol-4-reductase
MNALVTGATGFVGSRLARALLESGARVRCLVRDAARAHELRDAGAELHEGDLLRPETLEGAARGGVGAA